MDEQAQALNTPVNNLGLVGAIDPDWRKREEEREAKHEVQRQAEMARNLRAQSLEASLRSNPTNSDADVLLANANRFLAFLKGE